MGLVILLCLVAAASAVFTCSTTRFSQVNGSMCVNSQFVETFASVTSVVPCAILCDDRPQCQAFSLSDGPCQLFVFNKCSKSVRDCGCTRRGRVFVRQQPGLPPGLLCPVGYGDDWCGVKYRVHDSPAGTWAPIRSKCESESGLVFVADVTSAEELSHIQDIRASQLSSGSLWLGGFQAPGSAEPAGGWYWVGCNIAVDSGLWATGEPDDKGGQNATAVFSGKSGLVDFSTASFGLCECLSPLL